jgi:tetratricopeptide (TPR) repeat protein
MKYLYLFISIFILSACNQKTTTSNTDTTSSTDSAIVSGEQVPVELQELNKAVTASTGNPSAYNDRAKYYIRTKQFDYAYDDLVKGLQIDTTYMPFYNTLADFHLNKAEPAQAKAALEKAISINKKSYMSYVKLGELYFLVKKYDLAFEKINEGLRINKYYSDGYFWKGMIYREKKEKQKALSNFLTAVEQDPENFKAYMQMGLMSMDEGKKDALDHFNAAIRIRPNSTEGYYARAYFYQTNKELDKSIQDYTKIVELDSTYTNAHYNLGIIRYELKLIDLALIDFSRCIKVNPKYAEAYYMRGLCEEAKSMHSEALADFEFAIRLKGEYDLASKGIVRVNNTIKGLNK